MKQISKNFVKKRNESSHKSSCYFIEDKQIRQKFCEKENKIDKDDETEETKNQVIIT